MKIHELALKRKYKIMIILDREITYFLVKKCSRSRPALPPDAERIADAIRSHWEVENKAHWVLDVTFNEDDCRIRVGDGAENVAVIRWFALNLARLHPKKDSIRSKLKQGGWSDQFRSEIIFGQN